MLSFVCHVSVMALILTPLILVGLYFYAISDIGAEPNPFPDPWLDLAVGTALSFVIGLACASLMILTYRLLARVWNRDMLTKSPEPGC